MYFAAGRLPGDTTLWLQAPAATLSLVVSHHSHMSRRLSIPTLLTVSVAAALVIVTSCERRSASIPPCHFNLMQLELCKRDWAAEHNKTESDSPTWDDLRPYIPARCSNSIPVCPDGGIYTIGSVGEKPRCSIGGGYEHSLL